MGVDQSWVVVRLSAMRSFAGAAFVSVDESGMLDRCLPGWQNVVVNFYETACYMVRG